MSFAYKVLGQAKPSANTVATLYTVPADKQAVVSNITVCNQDTVNPCEFSVAVIPSGETLADKHYIYRDDFAKHRRTRSIALGCGLSTGDVVKISSTSGDVSFSLFGTEYTAPA